MRIIACSFALAAGGMGVGFVVALQEVLRQSYPAQGLWRPSLCIGSRGLAVGAAAGLTAAAVTLLLLLLWAALMQKPVSDDGGRSRHVGILECPAWAVRLLGPLALLPGGA